MFYYSKVIYKLQVRQSCGVIVQALLIKIERDRLWVLFSLLLVWAVLTGLGTIDKLQIHRLRILEQCDVTFIISTE